MNQLYIFLKQISDERFFALIIVTASVGVIGIVNARLIIIELLKCFQ